MKLALRGRNVTHHLFPDPEHTTNNRQTETQQTDQRTQAGTTPTTGKDLWGNGGAATCERGQLTAGMKAVVSREDWRKRPELTPVADAN